MTFLILSVFFVLSLAIQSFSVMTSLIPSLFVLAVFLISLLTDGYVYGIVSAFVSVLAVNFAFTFPYFKFNFTILENAFSALILVSVTVITGTLTTRIKRAQEARRLAENEKMRADLLRAVSHDLRTPLTVIYGSSSMLTENFSAFDDAKKLEIIGGIKQDSRWLIRMVENLLSVTRIDGVGVNIIRSPVVLEELIDSVLSKFKKNYPEKDVFLDIPEDFTIVLADPILAEQVILNILENAVQHAHGMTKLSLSVKICEKKAVFKVEDDGCGIDNEKLKTIFTGSCRSDKAPLDGAKRCMGIGLSVCASIVRAHGGEIYAKNRKGGGMIFSFTLDVEE